MGFEYYGMMHIYMYIYIPYGMQCELKYNVYITSDSDKWREFFVVFSSYDLIRLHNFYYYPRLSTDVILFQAKSPCKPKTIIVCLKDLSVQYQSIGYIYRVMLE